MTSEFLLKAIGQLDDELVLEAAVPQKRAIPWPKVAGLAAAIVLCAGIANIPGLLPMNGANSGAAAPETDGAFVGTTADDILADYEYRSDQESVAQAPSAADKENSKPAPSQTQGLFEPKFFTERGVYLPIVTDSGGLKKKLSPPESAIPLGELAAAIPGQSVSPSTGTQFFVGCPVWESEDGEYLYVHLPDGSWLVAALLD